MNRSRHTFIFPLLFILVFAMAARTPLDSDMWWHLRVGKWMVENRQPLTTDVFSHTRYGALWTNHSWLAQIGMALLFGEERFGLFSAAVAVIAAASLGFVYLQMDNAPIIRAFVIVLAGTVAAPVWTPRPQIASLLMLSVTGYLVHLCRRKGVDHLWLLIPLFVLWSNLHGGYVLGLMLLGATLLGDGVCLLTGDAPNWRPWRRLLWWSLASGFAVLLNPNGLRTWLIPFQTVGIEALQRVIQEWASPDFHDLAQQPLLWLLFALLGAVGFSKKRLDVVDFAVVVIFGYWAFLARRNFGPFALVAAPVLARHLPEGWQSSSNGVPKPRWGRPFESGLLLLLGAAALLKVLTVNAPAFVDAKRAEFFPEAAATWVQLHNPDGNLFNAYEWGGYLMWRLPEVQVFIDGRTDLYAEKVLTDYLLAFAGEAGWEAVFERYKIGWVLLPREAPLAQILDADVGWEKPYEDGVAVIYVRE